MSAWGKLDSELAMFCSEGALVVLRVSPLTVAVALAPVWADEEEHNTKIVNRASSREDFIFKMGTSVLSWLILALKMTIANWQLPIGVTAVIFRTDQIATARCTAWCVSSGPIGNRQLPIGDAIPCSMFGG